MSGVSLVILGDSAYPSLNWLVKPYNGCNLSAEESLNCYHSSAWMVVENAFGKLKARWRMLVKKNGWPHSKCPCCNFNLLLALQLVRK